MFMRSIILLSVIVLLEDKVSIITYYLRAIVITPRAEDAVRFVRLR